MINLRFSMEKAYRYMEQEIADVLKSSVYSDEEKQRLFYACGTCLHWILDYAERVDVSEEDKGLVSAFRFANNSLKHNKTLIEITQQTGGLRFPIRFPVRFPARMICWKHIECDNEKNKNQHKNYLNYLYGKSVVETCKQVIDILLKY